MEEPEVATPEGFHNKCITVVEAKKYKVNLDKGDGREENPPKQITRYIQTNMSINPYKKWGVLTNGKIWRLYSSEIDKYIEINLELAVKEPTSASMDELKLFSLLFSSEAFKIEEGGTTLLSRLREESLNAWIQIKDELEKNGKEILLDLVNGFYEELGDIAKSKSAAYDLLFKLFFVLYAEAKKLIPLISRYQEKSLRKIIKDAETTTLMRDKYDVCKRLGALFNSYKKVGGEFFEDNCEVKIKNRFIKDALEKLTIFEREGAEFKFFDYSSLNVELIGNIYESTLKFEFEEDAKTGSIKLKDSGKKTGTQAHSLGITYTPHEVVKYIVENTVDKKTNKIPKVCDPACGSGHFLVEALRHIASNMNYSVTKAESYEEHMKCIAKEGLFGTDVNLLAASITRLMFTIETSEKGTPALNMKDNIKDFNALLTKWNGSKEWFNKFKYLKKIKCSGFDCVIGNPPYVRADEPGIDSLRKDIQKSDQYKLLEKKWDLFIPFIELAVGLTQKVRGKVGFIVSNGITYAPYAEKCVEYLHKSKHVKLVSHFTEKFDTWAFPAVTFVYDWGNEYKKAKRLIHKNNPYEVISEDKTNSPIILKEKEQLRSKLEKVGTHRVADYFYISVGMVLNSHENLKGKGINFKKEELLSDTMDSNHPVPYIDNENIGYNVLQKDLKYIEYGSGLRAPKYVRRPTFPELHTKERLLFKRAKADMGIFITTDDIIASDNTIILKRWSDLSSIENASISKAISIRLNSQNKGKTKEKEIQLERGRLEKLSEDISYELMGGILLSETFKKFAMANKKHKHNIVPDVIYQLPLPDLSDTKENMLLEPEFDLSFGKIIQKEKNHSFLICYIELIVKELRKAPEDKIPMLKNYLDELVKKLYQGILE